MSDEEKTFSGSFVLDLRIWWRQAHTLYISVVCLTSSITISIIEEWLQISEPGRKQNESIFNNYSPKAKWILVNIPRDEVEGNIHQYSRAWGE